MRLSETQINHKYQVDNIHLDEKTINKLHVIGLTKATAIQVLNKNLNGSFIIKVRGARFAINKAISKGIEVSHATH